MVCKKRGENIISELERFNDLVKRMENKIEKAYEMGNSGKAHKYEHERNMILSEKEEYEKYGEATKKIAGLRVDIDDLEIIVERKNNRLKIRDECNSAIEQMKNDFINNANRKFVETEETLRLIET